MKHLRHQMTTLTCCFLITLSRAAFAVDCTTNASYAGQTAIQTGQRLVFANTLYECSVGGWCSLGEPYDPPKGYAWQYAWKALGECESTSPRQTNITSAVTKQNTNEAYQGPIQQQKNDQQKI